MRSLIRTTLSTAGIALGVLILLSTLYSASATTGAQASAGPARPSYCVPPELAGIEEQLAQKDASENPFLLARKQGALSAESQCAADATAYPPAAKSIKNAGAARPVAMPSPTPTLQTGLQFNPLGVVGNFLPTQARYNAWAGSVDGNVVEVAAGALMETDENGRPEQPAWSVTAAQGALNVVVNYAGLKAINYPTPARAGAVHLVAACGTTLVLQAADASIFTFDVAKMAYVSNPGACPIPAPGSP